MTNTWPHPRCLDAAIPNDRWKEWHWVLPRPSLEQLNFRDTKRDYPHSSLLNYHCFEPLTLLWLTAQTRLKMNSTYLMRLAPQFNPIFLNDKVGFACLVRINKNSFELGFSLLGHDNTETRQALFTFVFQLTRIENSKQWNRLALWNASSSLSLVSLNRRSEEEKMKCNEVRLKFI